MAKRRSAGKSTYCNPTGIVVKTYSEFVDAIDGAGRGDVIYVDGDVEIDMQGADDLRIPEGVTLASDRGCNGSDGGLLYTTNHPWSLFRTDGDVTIHGIRIRGPRTDWVPSAGSGSDKIGAGVMIEGKGVEIANSELSGFSHFAIQTEYDSHIHHNHIHHNPMKGIGYGVSANGGHPIIEFNKMNHNRHSVAASGDSSSYTVRYNIVGPNSISHIFDQHKPGGVTTKVHHNTVKAVEQDDDPKNTPTLTIRGVPSDVASVHHNWIYNIDRRVTATTTGRDAPSCRCMSPNGKTWGSATITSGPRRRRRVTSGRRGRGVRRRNHDFPVGPFGGWHWSIPVHTDPVGPGSDIGLGFRV
ncbi:MAG: right-handed parallel beta-helix repeat-containing protein [Bradymonadaceae bacterium]